MPQWSCGIPELRGEHVRVREVVSRDAPALFELLADPPVADLMAAPPPSVRAFAGFIAWAVTQRQTGESVCFGIVPDGLMDAVGIIQVRALEPTFFTAEWGFAIGAAFWVPVPSLRRRTWSHASRSVRCMSIASRREPSCITDAATVC
jgi:hypothetical protein